MIETNNMYNREYTPERISELKQNEVFVFGSNLAGSHGGGAARLAYNRFGAIWGQGVGLQGQSYAIPTMQGGVETIKPYVDEFIRFAQTRPDIKFYVTQIGCGIAGFRVEEIAPLFQAAIDVENVILPEAFVTVLSPHKPIRNSYIVMDRVYAGEYPGDLDNKKCLEKIRQFERFGITHFVDLTEKDELRPYSQLLPPEIQHVRFPIHDVSIPANVASVKELIDNIQGILQENDTNKVYIHCWGGVGRTGTIVGCLLSHRYNYDYNETMVALKKAFSDCPKSAHRVTPETDEQRDFIAAYIKRRDNMRKLQDRIRGSLIGGAIGDALGYPVEFMSRKSILHKYGDQGVRHFVEFDAGGKAVVSDDTQMTLFTANGLLFGVTRFCTHGILGAGLKDYVAYAYQDWLQTQIGVEDFDAYHYCWIRDIKELNVRRAPGNTCISALMSLKQHHEVGNDSKGCGGVMRVAPVGLMAAADELVMVKDWLGKEVPRRKWPVNEIVRLGGDCAEITHKHPLGYLPAAFMADLVYYILMCDEPITFSVLEKFLGTVYSDVKREYTSIREQKAMDELWAQIEKAVGMADDFTVSDATAIQRLGEGWTGDEALAIAIYCTMRHLDSIDDALAAAVNHDGDSDSTGAICGNLIGAIVGYDAIPQHFKQKLELRDLVLDIADDLFRGCPIGEDFALETHEERLQWERCYVKIEPVSPNRFKGVFSFLNTKYHIMPQALRAMEIRQMLREISSSKSDRENCQKGYQLALKVFDTETFDPSHPLPYDKLCNEPGGYFDIKGITPAYYYGFEEPKNSPHNSNRVFKLNILCFEGRNPVVAVRDDCNCQRMNQLQAGLMPYYDRIVLQKYPGWEFYRIDSTTCDGNYAVFTNQLEKEFAVEVAHLWEDGSLHRIYHLFY